MAKQNKKLKKITDRDGELKLSVRKIINMAAIVLFFTAVAKTWEHRRRREFKKAVKYRNFSDEKLKKVLDDFNILTSCEDPYIEHFYDKHPEFSTLHKLWVLNSHGYWTKKFQDELRRRAS